MIIECVANGSAQFLFKMPFEPVLLQFSYLLQIPY